MFLQNVTFHLQDYKTTHTITIVTLITLATCKLKQQYLAVNLSGVSFIFNIFSTVVSMLMINGTNKTVTNTVVYYQCNIQYLCFSQNWSHMLNKSIKMGDRDKYANLDSLHDISKLEWPRVQDPEDQTVKSQITLYTYCISYHTISHFKPQLCTCPPMGTEERREKSCVCPPNINKMK